MRQRPRGCKSINIARLSYMRYGEDGQRNQTLPVVSAKVGCLDYMPWCFKQDD